MPDQIIRDGYYHEGEFVGQWSAGDTPPVLGDPPCIVVMGRTAEETRRAFALLDARENPTTESVAWMVSGGGGWLRDAWWLRDA